MSSGFVKTLCTLGGAYLGYKNAEAKGKDPVKGALGWGTLSFLGSDLLFGDLEEEDTVNYVLRNNGRIVYHGIAFEDRIENRIAEHRLDGKVFDNFSYGKPKAREMAEQLEKKRIKRDKPKYNKHHK